jgi:hypothetical protein
VLIIVAPPRQDAVAGLHLSLDARRRDAPGEIFLREKVEGDDGHRPLIAENAIIN